MSYRDALERLKKIQQPPGDELTKPTKPGFGSFVSTPDGAFQNFSADAGACGAGDGIPNRPPAGMAEIDQTRPAGLQHPPAPCPTCGCGSFWQDADGWHCEGCAPAPDGVTRWRNVSGGTRAPMPPPALPWPAELNDMARRVATAFEWTDADRRDFVAWARRSAQGLADAADFLAAEVAKLPAPGLTEQRGDE